MTNPRFRVRKFAVIADEFAIDTPSQHLLDRFLIGFQRDGVFHEAPPVRVMAWIPNDTAPEVKRRREDFSLKLASSPSAAVQDADAVLIVSARRAVILETLNATAAGVSVHLYGLPSPEIAALAQQRQLVLQCGTEMSAALQLPALDLPKNPRFAKALIIAESNLPALDAVSSLLDFNPARARYIEGSEFWKAGETGEWSWKLLAAAISRTDKAQGNTVLDGRTEDIVGLGLTQSLAKNPRGWLLENRNGSRVAILNLEGVVADRLLAVELRGFTRRIVSTQLFQSPPPQREEFSRLSAEIARFFASGEPRRQSRNAIHAGRALALLEDPAARDGHWRAV